MVDADDLDLRDTRRRLRRLGLAAAVALVVPTVVIHWINSVSRAPNADPIGSSAVPLLAIGMFVGAEPHRLRRRSSSTRLGPEPFLSRTCTASRVRDPAL